MYDGMCEVTIDNFFFVKQVFERMTLKFVCGKLVQEIILQIKRLNLFQTQVKSNGH